MSASHTCGTIVYYNFLNYDFYLLNSDIRERVFGQRPYLYGPG